MSILLLFLVGLSASVMAEFESQEVTLDDFMKHGGGNPSATGSGSEFRKVSEMTLPNGKVKVRYAQYFDGVRVDNSVVATTETENGPEDVTGNMYKLDGKASFMSARIIGKEDAIAKAKEYYMKEHEFDESLVENEEAELMIDPELGEIYQVNFFVASPEEPARPYFSVEASSGKVLDTWEGLDTGADLGTGPGGNTRTGKYQYGVDYKKFEITKTGATCYLENNEVRTVNLNHGTGGVTAAYAYNCGTKNEQTHKAINGAYSPMNDAHYFGKVLYDMYRDWVQLRPLTFKLVIRVHYSRNFQNAFWNGRTMTFGDGGSYMYPLVDINVVTHEAAHGFTNQNSNLVYKYQSGGMNEAYSDMAGESGEFYMKGKVDWMVGADIIKTKGRAMRYFKRPEDDGRSIGHASKYYNGMDVHHSSGVYNKAFYLISNTQGWTIKKAFQMFTLANRVYWTSQATFNSGACGVMKAAKDLNLPEKDVVTAFCTVGVACPGTKCSGGGGGGNTCVDKESSCPNWKNAGYCTGTYKDYMKQNCPKSCGYCGGGTCANTCTGRCDCDGWAKYGYCKTNPGYMHKYCKKSCKLC